VSRLLSEGFGEGGLMDDLPPKLRGFIRALCAIANDAYPEGGMSCTRQVGVPLPSQDSAKALSDGELIASFLDQALGNYNEANPRRRDDVVSELRRIIREESGSELLGVQVEDDPGRCFSTLYLWWRLNGEVHRVTLFWSLE
jgi:hypothetical protein